MKNIEIVDFERANRLIAECGSPHYGLHLAITHADMFPSMLDEDIFLRMQKQVQIFKKNLFVPLLLENVTDSPQEITLYDHFPFSEPDKISKVIQDNDVDLLLDITHARIATMYRGWNIYDYIKALPLNRVREIHVNGPGRDAQGFPDDTHEAMGDEDYELLTWALTYTNPAIITLEYIGTPSETPDLISENLLTQLRKLNIL